MPVVTTRTDSGNADNFTFIASDVSLYIVDTAAILADAGAAINTGSYSYNYITNYGVVSGLNGVELQSTGNTVVNGSSGTMMGLNEAINIMSGGYYSTIVNSGIMTANGQAINSAASNSTIVNSGIMGAYYGVYFTSAATNGSVHNTGLLTGSYESVTSFAAGFSLDNSGQVHGDMYLTQSASVHNSGTIIGNISFGSGAHTIDGAGGSITGSLSGGTDADTFDLSHMSVSGTIAGGLGNDIITGTTGNDLIYGDNISGDTTGGNDTISGGYGDDTLNGGYGNDTLYGNQGDDVLYGNQGNDWMHGGQGDDTLYGGQNDDTLNGGLGNDVLVGGLGNDTFKFDINFGHDTIADFSVVSGNSDIIDFAPGTFNSYADVSAHMAQSGNDVIITLDANNSIDLHNVTIAQLTADHFLFA